MRRLIAVLIILVVVLQYRLWIGQGSLAELHSLKQEIALQEAEVTRLLTRNQELQAEVVDLSEGEEAVEERARTELGMIKAGEIFIQVIEKPKPESDTP
ncbi:cell division protein FtsB [Chromatium okenii]|jgi:cell division protein FtsB|uniref:Cell division protein FtsB n=1 Tax=Chromatium okenii TaxID=61644 RepID=A0A2S7XTG6_9GAMM|nr:cell division protein FtsB [Chromatium okenii]PQJ97034.1 cell division protein FtsB [Chromatium okenii]